MKKNLLLLSATALIILVIVALKNQADDQQNLLQNCKETNMFVIGDKGHVNRIYDCDKVKTM